MPAPFGTDNSSRIENQRPVSRPFRGNNRGRGGNQGQMAPPFGNNNNPPRNQGPMPMGPPPSNIPKRPVAARGAAPFAVDAGTIRNCIGRFTYIWLDNGNEFWMFPIQVGRRSVAGFRWMPRFGWTYIGVSLDRIDFFTCV